MRSIAANGNEKSPSPGNRGAGPGAVLLTAAAIAIGFAAALGYAAWTGRLALRHQPIDEQVHTAMEEGRVVTESQAPPGLGVDGSPAGGNH